MTTEVVYEDSPELLLVPSKELNKKYFIAHIYSAQCI